MTDGTTQPALTGVEHTNAAAAARQLLRGFKAFADAERALDVLAGYEQNVRELQAAADQLRKQRLELEAANDERKAELERQKLLDDSAAAQAKADAQAVVRRFELEADAAAERRDSLRAEVEALEARVAEARKFLDRLQDAKD